MAACSEQRVSIDGYETWEERSRFTVYKVLVRRPFKTWFVFRRYNDFHALHGELKKAGHTPPKIPKKRLMLNNFSKAFILHRMEGLSRFLAQLNESMLEESVMKDFLALNNTREAVRVFDEKLDVSEYTESHASSFSDENRIDLGENENIISDYQLIKVIGKGNFGKVLLAQHKECKTFYAIKVLQKSVILQKNISRQIMAERNVLYFNAKHPFLVALHSSFQSSQHLFLVLDYVNGGELFYHLQREQTFSEQRSLFYAAEISSALGYLHSMNIIYRDLKPENVLLDSDGHVRVTDFGLCKEGVMDGDTTGTFCGTPEYLAPEVLQKQLYTKAVDWWCLGCVLHEMLFGLPPWYSRDRAEMFQGILHGPLRLKSSCSGPAKAMIRDLLVRDPTERLGYTEDFASIQSHIFFESIDWDDLYERKVKPPWNPNVAGVGDATNFSEDFTKEAIPGSLIAGQCKDELSGDHDGLFEGFCYKGGEAPRMSYT